MSQKIICEIEDLDGYPQFRITVCSTGDTYMASKESEVWKKVSKNLSYFLNIDFLLGVVLLMNAYNCSSIPATSTWIGTLHFSVFIQNS